MQQELYRFPTRLAGNLALDFANTVEFRNSERCVDSLHSYEHVLAWCWQNRLVDDRQSARYESHAAEHPADAAGAFRAALDLRDALYCIFTSILDGDSPSRADLTQLNQSFAGTPRRVEPNTGGFGWVWTYGADLRDILAPIALEAAELLTSDQIQRVRQCPNCGWLFVDTSRNHSRRWCSMDVCGSQAKSRRQYQRRKTAKA